MTPFVGALLDNGITLLVGGLLIAAYFNKKRIAKLRAPFNKLGLLFLILGILSLIRGGAGVMRAYSQYKPLPSKAEILDEISKKEAHTEDLVYTSPKGFRVLIPKGFTHTVPDSPDLALIFLKEGASGAVATIKNSQKLPLSELLQGALTYMKKKNETYTFSSFEKINEHTLQVSGEVIKNGNRVKMMMMATEKQGMVYQLTLSCLADYYGHFEKEFLEIKNSFEAL